MKYTELLAHNNMQELQINQLQEHVSKLQSVIAAVAPWLSAALEDNICDEFRIVVLKLLEADQ